jgi:hypothetical protein
MLKIIEKAFLIAMERNGSTLLKVPSYQAGFKEGESVHNKIVQLLIKFQEWKLKKGDEMNNLVLLFIDLEAAYDRLDRRKLFEILRKRAMQ